jgi:hypothetical protein
MDNPQFEGPMPSLEDAPDPNRHDPQPPDTQGPRDHNGVTSEPLGPPEGYSPGVPI